MTALARRLLRLGSTELGGGSKLMDHAFFQRSGVSREAMERREPAVPSKPKLSGPTDCSNFDDFDDEEDESEPPPKNSPTFSLDLFPRAE